MDQLFTAENPFQLRAYRKQELAQMYFPDEGKESATRQLRRWIVQCSDLVKSLSKINYNKRRKFYTRPEVDLIVKFLGLP